MTSLRCARGFTLIELLIWMALVCIMLFMVVGVSTLVMGNFWYGSEGAFRELRVNHPEAIRLLKDQRGVWGYSVITVEEGGKQRQYYLDTNILWNYRFYEKR